MDEKDNIPKPIDLENHHPVLDEERPLRNDDLFNEETSSELVDHDVTDRDQTDMDDTELQDVCECISIALSVVSFLLLPFIFAVAEIVVVFLSRIKGAPILGTSAIVFGAL